MSDVLVFLMGFATALPFGAVIGGALWRREIEPLVRRVTSLQAASLTCDRAARFLERHAFDETMTPADVTDQLKELADDLAVGKHQGL